ncbi:MAG: carboxypeptidase-like regulatory domain-containing protein, partial [Flavitalea sp.]
MNFSVTPAKLQRGYTFKKFIEKLFTNSLMRIGINTLALVLAASNLLSASPVKGQRVDQVYISMELSHESLIDAFHKIENQSNFRFMYRYNEVKNYSDLNVKASGQSIETFLKLILTDTRLSYRQVKNQILIMPAKSLAFEPPPEINKPAKNRLINIVHGVVTNSKGDPVSGVSVAVKGTEIGTSTDENGNYSISVPANGNLIFSSIGFETLEVFVNNQTNLNVKLEESSRAMNEVVVTALGIKRQSKSLTYATQSLQGDKLSETKDVNMVNSLQGKVAGLVITRTANGPGSSSNVLLRGNRSITGNNAPLYVTDGVPGEIGLQDGDNIESVTILKGASAAALYGSAGQNGAILITTKRGTSGKMAFTYNGGLAFDQAAVYQDLQFQYGQGDAGMYVSNSEHSFGPKITGQDVTLWNGDAVKLSGQPNRFRDFFRVGSTLNNSISLTSGNEKTQTYFSYANIQAQGIMRNNNLNRHIFNLKVSNNVTSRLSIDAKVTYINETTDNAPNDYAVTSIFRAPVSIPLSAMQDYEYKDEEGNP